jgi:hypothetical protein
MEKMDGPGPRAAIRGFLGVLLTFIMLLVSYTNWPNEIKAAIPGLYMATWGMGEAMYDSLRGKELQDEPA